MQCEQCGVTFTESKNRGGYQRFCSSTCCRAWHHAHKPAFVAGLSCICKNCGQTFNPKARDRTTFCSRACAFEYKSAQSKQNAVIPEPRFCKVCGKAITSPRATAYCSDECRKEIARQTSQRIAASKKALKQVLCAECGKPFVPEYGDARRKFCSDKCNARYHKRIMRGTEAGKNATRRHNHSRRARLRNAFIESVDPSMVYDRDGWICKICGKPVDRLLSFPDPMSASLDHVVPLVRGGMHEASNVQLAHFICNSRKSGNLDSEIVVTGRGRLQNPRS